MCNHAADFNGHRVEVATVGSLKPGDSYRIPDGGAIMLVQVDSAIISAQYHNGGWATKSLGVDMDTGRLHIVENSTKLGLDREGRLYASRSLNPAVRTPAVEQPDNLGFDQHGEPAAVEQDEIDMANDGPYGRIE